MRSSFLLILLSCDPTTDIATKSGDTSSTADEDGDGYTADEGDCDDSDATVSPADAEICDGRDNDCDYAVDEELGSTFYEDKDLDGFGDPDTASVGCEGAGVTNGEDCDDGNASVFPLAVEICNEIDDDCDDVVDDGVTNRYYADADGDGFGDAAAPHDACTLTDGIVVDASDCDDSTDSINPGASESCDERDNDCNGQVDDGVLTSYYADYDGDGYGDDRITQNACVTPTGYAQYSGDCDDEDADYNPGADEIDCDDPNDYNCDGSTGFSDVDGDGFAACSECDDGEVTINPDAVEACDDVDNDCDGDIDEDSASDASTWYVDYDRDGYGSDRFIEVSCDAPVDYVSNADDCDDTSDDVNPAVTEICNDSDDDCDGDTDEDDAADAAMWYVDYDGDGHGSSRLTHQSCDAPSYYVAANDDCDDTEADVYPGAAETCDSVDNDCDSVVDNATDTDGDGATACDDCNDADAAVLPGAVERCNGLDDNCDGEVDEDTAVDAALWYIDYDGDGYGVTRFTVMACDAPANYVANDNDCDDTETDVSPVGAEVCNGVDDNCDGAVDEGASGDTWYRDDDGDGYGDAADSTESCEAPADYVADATDCDDGEATISPAAYETCDGVDDDCDGDVDENSAIDLGTWYYDADADGYGVSSTVEYACDAPAGYVADSTDCDDGSAAVSPGDTETCNSIDDDCDGAVDSAAACGCATDTYSGTGHTYLFCNTASYWPAASTACSTLGYHLVTMGSAAENAWVTSSTNSLMPSYDPWIGYNDIASEGSWVWDNGEAVTYTNWNSGEPNNSSNEDCTHLYDGGTWNDHQCSGLSAGYICESY